MILMVLSYVNVIAFFSYFILSFVFYRFKHHHD